MYSSCTDKCKASSTPSFSGSFSVVKSTFITVTYYKNILCAHICICTYVAMYIHYVHMHNMAS